MMEDEVEKAISLLAERITKDVKSEDAMRFSQAALNWSNVLAVKAHLKDCQDRAICE